MFQEILTKMNFKPGDLVIDTNSFRAQPYAIIVAVKVQENEEMIKPHYLEQEYFSSWYYAREFKLYEAIPR